jgi:outer membrane protein
MIPMTRRLLLGGVILGLTAPVDAQQTKPTLTLDEAISIAHERNPAYQRAVSQVAVAGAGVLAGWGTFLPTVNASLLWSGSSQTNVTGTDDFGQTIVRDESITFQNSSASQGLTGSITLFDGFQNLNNLRAARHDVDAAEFEVDATGLGVGAEVSRRFYGALRTDRLIEVEQQLLESANERLAANERLFRVAGASQVDVLGAQVDVAQQEQALERANGSARKARLEVLEQLGILDESLDFDPVGAFPQVFDPASLDGNDLVTTALRASPLVAQREAEVAAAGRRASAARGRRLPSVSLGAGFSRSLSEQDYGAFWELNPRNRNFGFDLRVQLPLFTGFQTEQVISQANANRRQAEEMSREARLQVERGVRSALIDLQNAHEGVLIQRRSTALSRQRVELAREQYRLGVITFTNLQQIIQQASSDERQLVQAEYDFAIALVNVEEQVGERLRPQP